MKNNSTSIGGKKKWTTPSVKILKINSGTKNGMGMGMEVLDMMMPPQLTNGS